MKKRRAPARSAIRYLVLWWQAQVPYAAAFDDEIAAHAAASVRNAIVIEISGTALKFEKVVDYYRRDDTGRPMPAEWRGGSGAGAGPRGPRPEPAVPEGCRGGVPRWS